MAKANKGSGAAINTARRKGSSKGEKVFTEITAIREIADDTKISAAKVNSRKSPAYLLLHHPKTASHWRALRE